MIQSAVCFVRSIDRKMADFMNVNLKEISSHLFSSILHLSSTFFFCHFIFFNQRILLYKILWFSVIHQQESALGRPIFNGAKDFGADKQPLRSLCAPAYMKYLAFLEKLAFCCFSTLIPLSLFSQLINLLFVGTRMPRV